MVTWFRLHRVLAHCSKTFLIVITTRQWYQPLPSVMGTFHKEGSTSSAAGCGAARAPAGFLQKLPQKGLLAKPPLIAGWHRPGNATQKLLCEAEQLVTEWGHIFKAHIQLQLKDEKWWEAYYILLNKDGQQPSRYCFDNYWYMKH